MANEAKGGGRTPGPWSYGVRRDGTIWLSIGDPMTGRHRQADIFAWPEDVRLMCAAPDLLAALKDQLDSHWATWMAARAEVEGVALSRQLFEKEPDVIRAREMVAKFEG